MPSSIWPIQSVLGYGELLQSAVQGDAARARLGALRQHGLLMLRLVNDLLDLGALQTGRFHLSPKPTRLFELVQQTVESMRPRAEAKGLSFHTVVAGTRDECRQADGERDERTEQGEPARAARAAQAEDAEGQRRDDGPGQRADHHSTPRSRAAAPTMAAIAR